MNRPHSALAFLLVLLPVAAAVSATSLPMPEPAFPGKVEWELYDLEHDFSRARNLAARNPDRLRDLQDLWWSEAARNSVLPLDWRAGERTLAAERPNPSAGRTHFVYYPGVMALPGSLAPRTHNRSWTATVTGQFDPADAGMLVTQGGLTGGWALYLKDGKVVFDYNYGLAAHYRVVAPAPASARALEARFTSDSKDGKPPGAGGTLALLADGREIGSGRLEHTLPLVYSMTDGLDVGVDTGSPVSDGYDPPFTFDGQLEAVTIDLN